MLFVLVHTVCVYMFMHAFTYMMYHLSSTVDKPLERQTDRKTGIWTDRQIDKYR